MSNKFMNMINFTVDMPFTFKSTEGKFEETKVLPLCISFDGLDECNEKQQEIVRRDVENFITTIFNATKRQQRLSNEIINVLLKYLGYSEEKVIYYTVKVGLFKTVKVYMCVANLAGDDLMPHIVVKHHMKIRRGDMFLKLYDKSGIITES